ncbi:FAD-dependent oxidoreductase [Candidatus Villigracilis affinis]|uniref:FAD-dependent oxidoreductase n=1 Tax=Candidatus Villigracilis affinis TaxID=3140682 RepID=UPI001D889EEB|nr:FAD-dependent oxidoreductase [Anaerolineales bacterium]
MNNNFFVAVIGAGPAGLFGARELAAQGARVAIFNRDVKAGGLAEYGIYPDKHTMKEGLRKQFRQVLDLANIDYYGNVTVGSTGDLTLDELRALGFDAVLVTAGAQGTKSLGLPGEELEGVYHAKDVVFSYNKLPPFSQKKFRFGKRCAIIGAGNVMVDVARHLLHVQNVDEVTAIVRRGPAEVNFTKDEMKHLISYLDLEEFDHEMERVRPAVEAIKQDLEIGRHKVLDSLAKADPKTAQGKFHFDFLASPTGMYGENGALTKLEVEDNILTEKDGKVSAKGTGVKRTIEVDTVIFAIGDKVDESFGLPTEWNEFIKNKEPRFPVDNLTFESSVEGVFVGGWSRKASEGLVGYARKDGTNAAKAVWQYLQTKQPANASAEAVAEKMKNLGKPVILKEDIKRLEAVEAEEAKKRGLEEFKFASNEEMLQAMGFMETA